ncbi:MAG TPA: flap endonuclease, partial [Acidimicrobiales bacterium]|nr:flap endonuclease [Acidimicrobiales bacterium]
PDRGADWDVSVRGGPALAATLAAERDRAVLFKDLATLRIDRTLLASVNALRWRGPEPEFSVLCDRIDAAPVARRAERLAERRGGGPPPG